MEIKFIPAHSSNYYSGRSGNSILYIVVHYTANNGDTAAGNGNYFSGANRQASAHYFVDENSIVQSVKDSDGAWHCGGSLESSHHPYRNICTNRNSIGIEMCSDIVNGKYVITEATVNRTVELVKMLMKKYNIAADHVIRHYDVTGKRCPEPWVRDESKWIDFKKRLTATAPAKQEEEIVTQDQFNKMMDTYLAQRDVKPMTWEQEAMKWAQEQGLIKGNEKGQLMPKSFLTRGEFVTVLKRYAEKQN